MSGCGVLVAGLLISVAYPIQVQAAVVQIQRLNSDKLEGKCNEAGGTFGSDDQGYGCTTENCDGKGHSCVITCGNDNKCYGTTPDVITGKLTFYGILHDGDDVVHGNGAPDDPDPNRNHPSTTPTPGPSGAPAPSGPVLL